MQSVLAKRLGSLSQTVLTRRPCSGILLSLNKSWKAEPTLDSERFSTMLARAASASVARKFSRPATDTSPAFLASRGTMCSASASAVRPKRSNISCTLSMGCWMQSCSGFRGLQAQPCNNHCCLRLLVGCLLKANESEPDSITSQQAKKSGDQMIDLSARDT